MLKSNSEEGRAPTLLEVLRDLGRKVPKVSIKRVEELYPDLWEKQVVHIPQINRAKDIEKDESASGQSSCSQTAPTAEFKDLQPVIKTEVEDVGMTDNLVVTATVFNWNRAFYSPHICPACNMVLKNKGRLMVHLRTHMSEWKPGRKSIKKETEVTKEDAKVRVRQYCCNFCGEVHNSVEELMCHKRTHFKEQYPCPECDLIFRTTVYLSIHIESVHSFIIHRKCPSEKLQERPKKLAAYAPQVLNHQTVASVVPSKVKDSKTEQKPAAVKIMCDSNASNSSNQHIKASKKVPIRIMQTRNIKKTASGEINCNSNASASNDHHKKASRKVQIEIMQAKNITKPVLGKITCDSLVGALSDRHKKVSKKTPSEIMQTTNNTKPVLGETMHDHHAIASNDQHRKGSRKVSSEIMHTKNSTTKPGSGKTMCSHHVSISNDQCKIISMEDPSGVIKRHVQSSVETVSDGHMDTSSESCKTLSSRVPVEVMEMQDVKQRLFDTGASSEVPAEVKETKPWSGKILSNSHAGASVNQHKTVASNVPYSEVMEIQDLRPASVETVHDGEASASNKQKILSSQTPSDILEKGPDLEIVYHYRSGTLSSHYKTVSTKIPNEVMEVQDVKLELVETECDRQASASSEVMEAKEDTNSESLETMCNSHASSELQKAFSGGVPREANQIKKDKKPTSGKTMCDNHLGASNDQYKTVSGKVLSKLMEINEGKKPALVEIVCDNHTSVSNDHNKTVSNKIPNEEMETQQNFEPTTVETTYSDPHKTVLRKVPSEDTGRQQTFEPTTYNNDAGAVICPHKTVSSKIPIEEMEIQEEEQLSVEMVSNDQANASSDHSMNPRNVHSEEMQMQQDEEPVSLKQ